MTLNYMLDPKLLIGLTSMQLIQQIGPPQDTGGYSRKQKQPIIFLYGWYEVYLQNSVVCMIYSDPEKGGTGQTWS